MGGEEEGMNGPIGAHPSRSVLFAQVADSDPRVSFDEGGLMLETGSPGSVGKAFLGDVAWATMRAMAPHDPPVFVKEPMYDEQRWKISCSSGELSVTISSRHYWGFGLLTRCFLNEIVIDGELDARARCAHDIAASLGRNPWEPSRVKAFERATSAKMPSHVSAWGELVNLAKNNMNDQIDILQDSLNRLKGVREGSETILSEAEESLDRARKALSDKNAPAVERALSRASSAIFRADPNTDFDNAERDLLEN